MERSNTTTTKKRKSGVAYHPVRECSKLLVHPQTLECALKRRCVACAYKIGCFDVSLDAELCRRVPNVRPELCPRTNNVASGDSSAAGAHRPVLGYRRGLRVLTLGDGDFSFSLAVARMVGGENNVWATSYETQQTLQAVYTGFDETLRELQDRKAHLRYQVDATRLRDFFSLENDRFDRIVWNFPCTAVAEGQDGQNQEMERNKAMVRKFVAQARHFLAPRGQIHVNHKTKPPFNQWSIERVALDGCNDYQPKVHYLGRVVLDRALLPPYVPRKALCRKSFPVHDACTYMFGLEDCLKEQLPKHIEEGSRVDSLLPVTVQMIERIRDSLLERSVRPPRSKKKSRTIR